MTTKEILALNMYIENNADIIQKHLKVIKPFEGITGEVPLEKLEKYIGLIQRKYALQIDYICPTFVPNEKNLYSATVRRTDTGRYLTDIYATTIYELFCKICILYNAVTKGKNFPLADWEGWKSKFVARLMKIQQRKNEDEQK